MKQNRGKNSTCYNLKIIVYMLFSVNGIYESDSETTIHNLLSYTLIKVRDQNNYL